jgi:hypothetical protein
MCFGSSSQSLLVLRECLLNFNLLFIFPKFQLLCTMILTRKATISQAKLKLNSVAIDRKRTIPTERPPLVGELHAGRGCSVVSATNSHCR